jgi:hypothetical protein
MAERSNKTAAQEERRAGDIIKAPASRRRCNCGDRAGQRPGSRPDHCFQDSGHIIQDGATAHPPQPRRTLKPGYPPDLQWNGLLHCPSDASQ